MVETSNKPVFSSCGGDLVIWEEDSLQKKFSISKRCPVSETSSETSDNSVTSVCWSEDSIHGNYHNTLFTRKYCVLNFVIRCSYFMHSLSIHLLPCNLSCNDNICVNVHTYTLCFSVV